MAADWSKTPTKGIVTRSVVALAVSKDNPKNIKGWADLVKPGVEVLTPNPFTSGGAWNVMAAYGAQIEQGKSEAEAVKYLEALFKNVKCRTSRRASRCAAASVSVVLLVLSFVLLLGASWIATRGERREA